MDRVVSFSNLVDLASETMGGRAVWASDNFFAFESGQKETHFADGTRRIAFPNGTVKWLS